MSARDRGAAAVLVIAAAATVMTATVSAMVITGVVVASQQARLAADLGALAGAARLQQAESAEVACATASRVVRANHARLHGCTVWGMELEVVVAVSPRTWPAAAVARARAGPEEPSWLRGSS